MNKLHETAIRIDRAAGDVESIALAVLGRIASWVAPVPVAVMTAKALEEIFALPFTLAAVSSAALELVGMTTSALWLDLVDYNDSKRKSDPEAKAGLAKVMMIAYFVIDIIIIIAVSVKRIIDAPEDWSPAIAILFPIVSAVGVIVLNQRVRHYRRLAQIDADKAERSARARMEDASLADVRAVAAQLNGNRDICTADWLKQELETRGLRASSRRTLQDWSLKVRRGEL